MKPAKKIVFCPPESSEKLKVGERMFYMGYGQVIAGTAMLCYGAFVLWMALGVVAGGLITLAWGRIVEVRAHSDIAKRELEIRSQGKTPSWGEVYSIMKYERSKDPNHRFEIVFDDSHHDALTIPRGSWDMNNVTLLGC